MGFGVVNFQSFFRRITPVQGPYVFAAPNSGLLKQHTLWLIHHAIKNGKPR